MIFILISVSLQIRFMVMRQCKTISEIIFRIFSPCKWFAGYLMRHRLNWVVEFSSNRVLAVSLAGLEEVLEDGHPEILKKALNIFMLQKTQIGSITSLIKSKINLGDKIQ